jgi:hypothetical protein
MFSDPTLEVIANEFIEILRVKHNAEAKLVALFNKFAEESVVTSSVFPIRRSEPLPRKSR